MNDQLHLNLCWVGDGIIKWQSRVPVQPSSVSIGSTRVSFKVSPIHTWGINNSSSVNNLVWILLIIDAILHEIISMPPIALR